MDLWVYLKRNYSLKEQAQYVILLREAKQKGVNVIVGGGDSIAALKSLEIKTGLVIFQQEEGLF